MVERRTGDDGSFLADGLAASAPSLVFGTGRVCIEPTCDARLSRYNSTEWCALHESPASTQRPYDTSTRQRGRRRNSSTRRRRSATPRATSAAGAASTAPSPSPSTSTEDRRPMTGSAGGPGVDTGAANGRRASDPAKARSRTAA